MDALRTGLGVGISALLSYSIPVLGGGISWFVAPAITDDKLGADITRAFTVVFTLDALAEMLVGGRGVM